MAFEKTNQCKSKIDEYSEWLNTFPEDYDEIQYRFDVFKAELNSMIEDVGITEAEQAQGRLNYSNNFDNE